MPASPPMALDPKKVAGDVARGVAAISTLPEITTRIIAAIEDPNSSAQTLHRIVAHDPALVARVIKVVNSAFYGLPGRINTIDRAIVMLGLTAIKNLAVAASLGQVFRRGRLCDGFSTRDLWTHCVAVAVAARHLAKLSGHPEIAEEAFLSGMIHDIGILVELQTWPERLGKLCNEVRITNADFRKAERQATGVDHTLLGRALAEQWKFPASCQQVAAFHHHPVDADPEFRTLVSIVHVADLLACRAAIGFNLTAVGHDPDPGYLADLHLDAAQIETFQRSLPGLVNEAMAVFG